MRFLKFISLLLCVAVFFNSIMNYLPSVIAYSLPIESDLEIVSQVGVSDQNGNSIFGDVGDAIDYVLPTQKIQYTISYDNIGTTGDVSELVTNVASGVCFELSSITDTGATFSYATGLGVYGYAPVADGNGVDCAVRYIKSTRSIPSYTSKLETDAEFVVSTDNTYKKNYMGNNSGASIILSPVSIQQIYTPSGSSTYINPQIYDVDDDGNEDILLTSGGFNYVMTGAYMGDFTILPYYGFCNLATDTICASPDAYSILSTNNLGASNTDGFVRNAKTIAILDLNNDGLQDIFYPSSAGIGTSTGNIRFGSGINGSYGPLLTLPSTHNLLGNQFLTGDFNNDGFDDLVSRTSAGNMRIIYGATTTGAMTRENFTFDVSLGANKLKYVVTDANHDGISDVVFVHANASVDSWLSIATGSALGGMTVVDDIYQFNEGPRSPIALSNMSDDGYDDIVTNIFIAHTTTGLQVPYATSVSDGLGGPTSIAIADIDNDGYDEKISNAYSSQYFFRTRSSSASGMNTFGSIPFYTPSINFQANAQTAQIYGYRNDINNDTLDDVLVATNSGVYIIYGGSVSTGQYTTIINSNLTSTGLESRGVLTANETKPIGTDIQYTVYPTTGASLCDTGSSALLASQSMPVSGEIDLSSLSTGNTSICVKVDFFSTDKSATPTLDDLMVRWSPVSNYTLVYQARVANQGYTNTTILNAVSITGSNESNLANNTGSHTFTYDLYQPTFTAQTGYKTSTTPLLSGQITQSGVSNFSSYTMTILINGTINTGTVSAGGMWTLASVSPALADNTTYSYTGILTDPYGNMTVMYVTGLMIDATAPSPLTLDSHTHGQYINDPEPIFSGTAESGTTVSLTIDGQTFTVIATSTGWSFNIGLLGIPLTQGAKPMLISSTDAAGNISEINPTIIVDTDSPTIGTLAIDIETSPYDKENPYITRSGSDNIGLSGMRISVDGGAFAEQTSPYTPSLVVAPYHTLIFRQYDKANNYTEQIVLYPPVVTITYATLYVSGGALGGITGTITPATMSISSFLASGAGAAGFTCNPTIPGTAPIVCGGGTISTGGVLQFLASNGLSTGSNQVTFIYDNIQPVPTLTLSGTNPTNTNPIIIHLQSSEALYGVSLGDFSTSLGLLSGIVAVDAYNYYIHITPSPSSDVETGTITLAANSVQDVAGNSNASSVNLVFVSDVVAPSIPTVTYPASGGYVSGSIFTFVGIGEVGASVVLVIDGVTYTGVVDNAGNRSITLLAPLVDGTSYPYTMIQVDTAGNSSSVLSSYVTVDTTLPTATKSFTSPVYSTGSTVISPLTGTLSETGCSLFITINGTTYTGTISGTGWTLPASSVVGLLDGTYSATFFVIDAAGNIMSPVLSPFDLVVDTTIATGTLSTVRTNLLSPLLTGSLIESGGTLDVTGVTLMIDGGTVYTGLVLDLTGSTRSLSSGTISPNLSTGTHTAILHIEDLAGNVWTSASFSFTIDTEGPIVSVISPNTTGVTTNDNTPTFSGTVSETGGYVMLVIGGVTYTGVVSASGTWTITPASLSPDGVYTGTLILTDDLGNATTVSPDYVFVIDTTAPSPTTVTYPTSGGYLNTGTITVTGTLSSGDRITIYDGSGVVLCIATGNASNTYSCGPIGPLSDGTHTIIPIYSDIAGNIVTGATMTFTTDTIPPALSGAVQMQTASGVNQSGHYAGTSGAIVTSTSPSESGGIATIIIKTSTGVVIGTYTGVISSTGSIAIPITYPTTSGTYTIDTTLTDLAGNTSVVTTTTLYVRGPSAPMVTTPVSPSTMSNGGSVVVTGVAGTGSVSGNLAFAVLSPGGMVVSGYINGSGIFVLPSLTIPSTPGTYTISVYTKDSYGNTGTASILTIVVPQPVGPGGGPGPIPDYCPNGDRSSSGYYDGRCEDHKKFKVGDICPGGDYSGSPTDGRCDAPSATGIISVSTGVVSKIEDALGTCADLEGNDNKFYCFAHEIKSTTKNSLEEARFGDYMTRAEMAKMISNFVTQVLKKKSDTSIVCEFGDKQLVDEELQYYMQKACQLGIMGVGPNHKAMPNFFPNAPVTMGQYYTAISRVLFGKTYELKANETDSPATPFYYRHLANLIKEKVAPVDTKPNGFTIRGEAFAAIYKMAQTIVKYNK